MMSGAVAYRFWREKAFSRSPNAVVRVYDEADNVIETVEHAGEFKEWCALVAFE
jgi:hypothetical protein